MNARPAYFYQFSGLHAFLTGLMPFFLPVILWRDTHSLALVSGFISLSGLGFLISLLLWEKLRAGDHGKLAIAGSFIAEAVLITALILEELHSGLSVAGVLSLALLNGFYGCFYWLSLRVLFISQSSEGKDSSGNRFGNFQLVVGILLKLGILAGAILLDSGQDIWLVVVTLLVSAAGGVCVYSQTNSDYIKTALSANPVQLSNLFCFRPGNWSRSVFVLDGLFLFMESYFWVLSLYLLSNESFTRLGLIVVALAVILSLLFLVIKSRIDSGDSSQVFTLAVILYSLSWVLRGWIDNSISPTASPTLFSVTVILIAFMTSFFRLSFNKIFFDRIEIGNRQLFVLAKSWYTQFGVTVFFALLALVFQLSGGGSRQLATIYWLSAPLALIYFLYARQASPSAGLRAFFPGVKRNAHHCTG